MNPAAARRRFELFLKERKLRVTQQRLDILDLAWETHDHFSAEQMFGWARVRNAHASRATVYRTLNLMLEGRFLSSFEASSGAALFEHALGHNHHDHILCLKCGKIEEFHCDAIEKLQEQEAQRLGFQLVDHALILEGHCASCSSTDEL